MCSRKQVQFSGTAEQCEAQGGGGMSIKLRLLISYMAMLFIPVILTGAAAVVIGILYFGGVVNYSGSNFDNMSIKSYIEKNYKILEQIAIDASMHPEKFEDANYIKSTDEILNTYDSGMVIKENDEYTFVSKLLENSNLLEQLKSAKWESGGLNTIELKHELGVKGEIAKISKDMKLYAVCRYKIVSNNKNGEVYIFTNVSPLKQFLSKYFTTLVAVIILILLLTNIALTYYVSKSITKPIDYLKKAANEIKNGNLDFEVNYKSKDEIGELSSAFEEMRVKLKESIELEQQYEQNRKELVSSISHDLKTPITAVKGYVEGIIDGVADSPDKMDKYIKTIYTKTNEIDRLIDELFLYSKLDMKKLAFNFEKVEIKKYFEHCVEELYFDLESKGIKLILEPNCNDETLVIADREKLNRVVTNILYNAVKYMDMEKGKVVIELEEEDNDVVVRITDNGQGISEGKLPFIFDRFYRADPARNTQKGGSGLGLSIAKHIIEEHGGRIWAQSRKAVGTTIAFTLKKTQE